MTTVKTILTKLADQFETYYAESDKSTEGLKAAAGSWAFAAAELRGAAAASEDLHVTSISPANIAEGAINLYREYLDRYIADLSGDDIDEIQERAKAAAILDTLEGVEADVSVPSPEEIRAATDGAERTDHSDQDENDFFDKYFPFPDDDLKGTLPTAEQWDQYHKVQQWNPNSSIAQYRDSDGYNEPF